MSTLFADGIPLLESTTSLAKCSDSNCVELRPSSSSSNTDERIDRVAFRIAQMSHSTIVRFTLELGEIVYRELIGNDVEEVRRKGKHYQSFRKLAAHPAIPFSAGTLWRAVAMYELSLRLPHLFSLENIGVSHYRAVLHLPDATKECLLVAASTGRWTKAQMELAASRARAIPDTSGPAPLRTSLKSIRQVEKTLLSMLESVKGRLVSKQHKDEELAKLRECVRDTREVCEQLFMALASEHGCDGSV